MPDIRSLTKQKPTQAVIDLGDGETVTMTFDANAITPAWVSRTQENVNAEDTLSLPKALAEVMLGWDITNDDRGVPPSAKNLAVFSFPVMGLLFEAIMGAAVPSSEEGNASSDTSSTASTDSASRQASPQNGADTSVSQNVSAVAPGT